EVRNHEDIFLRAVASRTSQKHAIVPALGLAHLGFERAGLSVKNLHLVMRGRDNVRQPITIDVIYDQGGSVLIRERPCGPRQLAVGDTAIEAEAISLSFSCVHAGRKRNDLLTRAIGKEFANTDVSAQ